MLYTHSNIPHVVCVILCMLKYAFPYTFHTARARVSRNLNCDVEFSIHEFLGTASIASASLNLFFFCNDLVLTSTR